MFDIKLKKRAWNKNKNARKRYFDMDFITWIAPALSLLFENENNLEMCLFDRKRGKLQPLNTFLADKIMTHIFQMQERDPEGLWVNRISWPKLNARSKTSGTGLFLCACVWKWLVVDQLKATMKAWRHHKKQLSIIAWLFIGLSKIGH